ncbi:MAG: hypothetical protein CM15mP78_15510 [Candidatus Poseidoniales archaeon]|nr:MAG: hypothetical protein CM15mP78_15510 [Candidatus Poseidoniales archaeon]
MIHHFEHFLEAAPELLTTGGFDADLGRRAVFDPREYGEFIFIVVPDFMHAVNNAGEDVGHLLVGGLTSTEITVVAGVEGDVASVDGTCSLEGRFDFCKGAPTLNFATEQFRVVRPVDVHFKVGLVGEHAGLPVLLKVLGGDHADGLHLHGLETQRNDVVHPFHDGATFAGKRNTSRTKFDCHPFPSPETDPRAIT